MYLVKKRSDFIKRIIGLVLVFVMVMTLNPVAYSAEITENKSVEVILNNYHARIADVDNGQTDTSAYSLTAIRERNQIKQETFEELASAGYQAYDVNPDTYDSVESALQTDLSELGIESSGTYIIVLSGDPENNNGIAPAAIVPAPDIGDGSGFSYTYGGVTYSMRYITVYADEAYLYRISEDIDLVEHSIISVSLLEDILNTAVSISLDQLGGVVPIGTIMDICGVSIYNFDTSDYITMTYNANTNWTRTFTQVWNSAYSEWVNSSSVEYVTSQSYISGDYYDRNLNRYASFPRNEEINTFYSEHYNDYTWRKQNAVIGYLNFRCMYDMTGPVKYYHNGDLITTHRNAGLP